MKSSLLTLLLLFSIALFAQNGKSWYKQIRGTVDRYPVTMHLHKAGHSYFGYYYYETQQNPVYISGEDSTQKGTVKLVAFSSPEATEAFSFVMNGPNIKGVWRKEEKSKPLSFTGTEISSLVPFSFVYTEGERLLQSGVSASPRATFFAASIWPVGSHPTGAYMKTALIKTYDQKAAIDQEIGTLMLRHKNDFFKSYQSDFREAKAADVSESPSQFMADQTEQILLVFQNRQMATIAHQTYVYSGGAHGNHGTSYHVYDLTARRKLTLSDVLTANGKKQLPALLTKALRRQFGLKPSDPLTEVLFENAIAPNQNFYLTGKGIGFSYNPYEIAAYAFGEINLFIPFTELAGGLQPILKTRLQ